MTFQTWFPVWKSMSNRPRQVFFYVLSQSSFYSLILPIPSWRISLGMLILINRKWPNRCWLVKTFFLRELFFSYFLHNQNKKQPFVYPALSPDIGDFLAAISIVIDLLELEFDLLSTSPRTILSFVNLLRPAGESDLPGGWFMYFCSRSKASLTILSPQSSGIYRIFKKTHNNKTVVL